MERESPGKRWQIPEREKSFSRQREMPAKSLGEQEEGMAIFKHVIWASPDR